MAQPKSRTWTIRELLAERGLTWRAVGEAIERNPVALAHVARGRTPLTRKLRGKLARYFDVPPEAITTDPPRAMRERLAS